MIKTRQKNIRTFEFDGGQTQEYIEFITKNFILLKDYLLVFKTPLAPELSEFIHSLGMTYLISTHDFRGKEYASPLSQSAGTKIYHRNIRSGEEIESSESILVLGNVNNGARIVSDRNVSIFGKCDGIIVCGGEYLVLRGSHSQHIVFRGEILGREIIDIINANELLKIIIKNGDNISIKEIK
ncbi:hypothetical protein BKH46_03615 [Helicobacter sp. 12S02634-8]|uniref:septum site-determining protein MinC n=1 Tax=Helicobacter sp. 12S02634-8 TaxID=1476199 RepID=UPI000BA77784|nr:septum site-determining protein MinC [Helicobacter sp. 12S02634-8]PAF47526.1 hypothetical protein BKH46_03615 [Helicobacter sp. 12S02634-8]